MPLRVCPIHGLTPGPDGKCVLCHRNAPKASETSSSPVVGLLLGAALIAALTLSWKMTRPKPEPPPEPIGAVVATPTADPEETAEDREVIARAEAKAQDSVLREQQRKRDIALHVGEVQIVMYTTRPCALCDTARAWLKERGLAYRDVDVGSDASALAEMHKLTPGNEVPVFDVDGEVLVGFGPTNVAGAVQRAADKRTR